MKPLLFLVSLILTASAFAQSPASLRKATPADARFHVRSMQQLQVRELYSDYFVLQGLTPSQTDDLVRALADERVLIVHWSTGGVTHEPSDYDRAEAVAVMARIEAMLGREKYHALMQYRESLPERMQLQQLSTWLRTLGHPLSSAQKEDLVAIMVAERYRRNSELLHSRRGTSEYASELMALYDASDRQVLALFAPVLTPLQREIAAKQFEQRSERRQDALERHARALAEGDQEPFSYSAD